MLPAALGQPEPAAHCHGANRTRVQGEPEGGGPPTARDEIQLSGQSETREGANNPDRDAQFQHINTTVKAAIADGQPAISVDTKKKELVGDPRVKPEGRLSRMVGGNCGARATWKPFASPAS